MPSAYDGTDIISYLRSKYQLVEKVFFDKLSGFEKHTQTRKESPSAYKSTVGDS